MSFDMASRRLRGFAALVALVILTVGVPLVLSHVVGRPWPRPLPSVDVVWRSLRSGDISDGTVLKTLAVVMWIAWARLAISIVIEVIACATRVRVPRVVGLGRAQHWAAALVASVILLVGVAPRPIAAAPWSSATAAPRPITAALLDTHPWADRASDHEVEAVGWKVRASAPEPAGRTSVHVVQRHESFWSIAEHFLGDGSRWREIVAMNTGREVAPGVLFGGTPDRLLPGWELVVPTGTTGGGTADFAAADHTVVVERGDTLSGIAARELGEAADWPALWESNHDRHFGQRVFDDPDLILPGWELIIPEALVPPPVIEAPAAIPTAATPTAVPSPPVLSSRLPSGEAPIEPIETHDDAHDTVATLPPTTLPPTTLPPTTVAEPTTAPPLAPGVVTSDGIPAFAGVGSAVLLAAGVAGAAEARRRRRLRAATVNARLATPTPRLADLDRLIRKLDAGERIARLDIALRAVGHALFTTAPGTVLLGAIDSDEGDIDVLLDRPLAAAPAPWAMVTGHRWRLPAAVGVVDLASAARQS